MAAGDIFVDFVAGWTSGVTGLLVSHPLDTVKVRLQSLDSYNGAFHCISQTLRQESIRGFYKGMAAPLATAGFLHSTFFLGYSASLSAIEEAIGKVGRSRQELRKEHSLGVLLLATAVGATLQWIPSCPIELVKTRLQVQRANLQRHSIFAIPHPVISNVHQRPLFTGPVDCLRQTLRDAGVRGLYRGGFTMLLRDIIGFIFYLPVYELTLRWLKASSDNEMVQHLWAPMLSGGLAGVTGWWSILPLDVLKSRLQADDPARPKYYGLWHCAKEMYRKEGLASFAKGWHVAALRGFPACACLFLVYEQTIHALSNVRRRLKSS